jgi:hypothetical protein
MRLRHAGGRLGFPGQPDRCAEVMVEGAYAMLASMDASTVDTDDIEGALDRIRGHGRPTSQCLQHDQTERLGSAWENEDVGAAVECRELAAVARPEEASPGMSGRKLRQIGAIADDHGRARLIYRK